MVKIFLILLENKMKISITTTMTDPESRKDPWREALKCYEEMADEVIITGQNWKYDFKWNEIGEFFQEGLDKASGDWVIRMDLDYFFHEKDFLNLRKYLAKNFNQPAVAFPKCQFFTPDRYSVKSNIVIACILFKANSFRHISYHRSIVTNGISVQGIGEDHIEDGR